MPVILATQEAEIKRIVVQSQPQANSFLCQKNPIITKGLVYALSSDPSAAKKSFYMYLS
jgi:hypothetical protein